MAGRPKNRLELRRQYEAAEPLDPVEADEVDDAGDGDDEEVERKPKRTKAKTAAKPKTRAVKAAKPAARMRIVWLVVNDAFKTIATFEYSQRAAAEAKVQEMMAKGKGVHFIQKGKEAMPDNAPGLGAAIPRDDLVAAAPAAKAAPIDDDESEPEPDPDDDDSDDDFEDEPDDED
jgi:hypothetical protein